jgi:cell division septation protein DedD
MKFMEQKKVQRIIGIVVVIALVIIVMPLLFGKSDFLLQEASTTVKAPPFRDQQPTVATTASDVQSPALASADTNTLPQSSNPEEVKVSADKTAAKAKLPEPPVLSSPVAQVPADKATDSSKVDSTAAAKKINDDSSSANAASTPAPGSIVYEPVSAGAPTTPPEPAAPVVSDASNAKSVEPVTPVVSDTSNAKSVEPVAPVVSDTPTAKSVSVTAESSSVKIAPSEINATYPPVIKEIKVHSTKIIHAKAKPISVNKLKSSTWAVQVGNFAVKKNAVHLANVLHAAGYKTFMRDVKTANGKINTRVYIGPELLEASASRLSKNVNNRLSVQGFVVKI